tara:strand:+ start:90 stop:935 length:846 start_codon:yes stop_codon:yes gene_type:complete
MGRKRRKSISNRFITDVHGRTENRNQQYFSRKKKSKKKYKQQKFFAKISEDGKIDKKEAEKAAKKGYDLAKIRRHDARQFNRAQDVYSNRDDRSGMRNPAYAPLLISRGAEGIFGGQQRETGGGRRQSSAGGGGKSSAKPSTPTQPTNQYQSQIEGMLGDQRVTAPGFPDPYADALASLQQTIAGIQMPDYGAELDAMRAEQERYMQELAAQQAEAERQRELAFRTSQENMTRGGLTPDFRIGARSPRDRFGTGGFKRRLRRPVSIAQGIAPSTAGQTLNV